MEENVDNYSDVDWSDDAGSDEEGVNESAGHSETLQIDIGGSTSKAVDEKKRKREICTYNDEDRLTTSERLIIVRYYFQSGVMTKFSQGCWLAFYPKSFCHCNHRREILMLMMS
jgi:hypothetical protein